MKSITLEELLEAGCHFGHQVTRQNPKAREFVFEQRDNIQIIDLGKTKEGLEEAASFLLKTAQTPESTLLVVGTKRQAIPLIEETLAGLPEEVRKSMFTVTKRWMGGTLTNTVAISQNYERLKEIKEKLHSDEWKQKYTKRELVLFEKEMQKLEAYYGGIVDMKKMPAALFVIDTHTEDLAVKEANRMGIPVVGIVDTNADPDLIDYVIPANDDAVGSLKLLIGYIFSAWVEGKTGVSAKSEGLNPKSQETKEKKEEKESSTEQNLEKKEKSAKKAKSSSGGKKEKKG
ncbi:MAG TPA: 30S ribosomal protein S2 [Patescibacteria group bacterium]|nr:30S ribosomal protein S2 [Patescibacteria group bacterium]